MRWLATILAWCGFDVSRTVGPPRARPKPKPRRHMPTANDHRRLYGTEPVEKRPKLPKPYESWADWCLDHLEGELSSELPATLYGKMQVRIDAARAELDELRNELALFKATAEQEETGHVFTTT